eukprot:CAMPEP_0197575278 /NCGR_PEP_ID=MMETSP1326-20131121/731_1 /TAXON_ID=1155430 /ORGANISM="Genus nov. species nov., Strain RCC2288" /LENGTH=117 /DNA_ID=CAMNT_0043138017 /DNA_START=191 /DNA_END=540 /DNA_ORIENTATION=+
MAAAAATMVAPPGAPPSWVTLRFRVKYWTVWGQNLVLCGSDPRLGAWDVRKGVFMHCHHVGEEELLWTGKVRGAFGGAPFQYRYAVVDGDMNVVKWCALTHTVDVSPALLSSSRRTG